MLSATKTSKIERFVNGTGDELEIPVARIVGAKSGPRFGVSAGMHSGESAGMHACIRLFREIDPFRLRGDLTIVPIMSTRAFFSRSMQLSPVDEKELHFQAPGNPSGSYSDFHIDTVFELLRHLDFHIDMHGAEQVQALDPWVAFPRPNDPEKYEEAILLAGSFPVPYIDARTPADMPYGLPFALLEQGVVNAWSEIGLDHRLRNDTVEMQFRGVMNALCRLEMLDVEPRGLMNQTPVGPKRWTVRSEVSGYWNRKVDPGQRVSRNQLLGEVYGLAGDLLDRHLAPEDALVQFVTTSPAINAERTPHGYDWHRDLVRLAEVNPLPVRASDGRESTYERWHRR